MDQKKKLRMEERKKDDLEEELGSVRKQHMEAVNEHGKQAAAHEVSSVLFTRLLPLTKADTCNRRTRESSKNEKSSSAK